MSEGKLALIGLCIMVLGISLSTVAFPLSIALSFGGGVLFGNQGMLWLLNRDR